MFEGWVSELLASYLGHFLDVKKEQLRVSLWKGGPPLVCLILLRTTLAGHGLIKE